jgi:C1A family cysteine protease
MINLFELKQALIKEKKSWTAEITSVSHNFRRSESNLFGLNIEPDLLAEKGLKVKIAKALLTYPAKFDWRDHEGKDCTTPIKDQNGCGACVAFAVISVWESLLKINKNCAGADLLSEAFLFFCSGQNCKRGWHFVDALNFAQKTGTVDEACFPYTGVQSSCEPCEDSKSRIIKISGWDLLGGADEAKHTVSRYGPVLAAMEVYEDFGYYTGGIYEHVGGDFLGNHAISIVGYDDAEGCWICKNSWGTGWGESGWFKISYRQCKIDAFPKFRILL